MGRNPGSGRNSPIVIAVIQVQKGQSGTNISTSSSASTNWRRFHADAAKELTSLSEGYLQQISFHAGQLAVLDGSSEIQPGHVRRAKAELERQKENTSTIKTRVKSLLQIIGAVLVGIAATGIILNASQTFEEGMGYIVVGGVGVAMTSLGVFMKS